MSSAGLRPPRALVLAAGLGSRIRAVAGALPKPLLPFDGEPVLLRNLRWLAGSGVREVTINLHYAPETIRGAAGDGGALGLSVDYAYEPELLGTAGALANIAGVFEETMVVVYGDNLVRFDLAALLERHAAAGASATLALFDQARHLHTGIAGGRVLLDGAGAVSGFAEGGAAGLVNAGVYAVEPAVLGFFSDARPLDWGRDVFPAMLAAGAPLAGHLIEDGGYCLGLDTPESLAGGRRLLDEGRLAS